MENHLNFGPVSAGGDAGGQTRVVPELVLPAEHFGSPGSVSTAH